MRACVAAVALFSLFGCGSTQTPMDAAPETAADAPTDVSSVDAVDVPIAMDVQTVDRVPPSDVTCSPACFFFEECIGGRCVGRPDVQDTVPEASPCAPMQTLCAFGADAGSACYDLQTSWERCGACDTQCAYDSLAMMRGICAAGRCVCRDSAFTACPSPGAGEIRTLVICVNLQNDVANCGTCGNACIAPATCRAGRCMN